jgi:uncharacterized delta-60 repeat protein
MARFNSDGGLDQTFGSAGILTKPMRPIEPGVQIMRIAPDGSFFAAGTLSHASNRCPDADTTCELAVRHFSSSLDEDLAFGTDGVASARVGASGELQDLAVQADGKPIVVGYASVGKESCPWAGSNCDFAFARFGTNGALDTSFGENGRTLVGFGKSVRNKPIMDAANAVILQPDGKIVAVGGTSTWGGVISNSPGDFMAIARLLPNGQPDPKFSGKGHVSF